MEKLIITLFLEQDWTLLEYITATEQKQLRPYVEHRIEYDIQGRVQHFFRLNEEGNVIARFLMRQYHRKPDSSHGLAIETRQWLPITLDSLSKQDIANKILSIAPDAVKMSEHGRYRFQVKDLDSYLRVYADQDCPVFLFLKSHSKTIRKGYFSEIIVW